MRRTMIGLDPDVDLGTVRAVADVMASHESWTPQRTAAEVQGYLAVAAGYRPFGGLPLDEQASSPPRQAVA
jgi:hypothetical protein